MEENAAQHSNVPDVVAASDVVKSTRQPALGDLGAVENSATEVDQHGLCDRSIEVRRCRPAALHGELNNWEEAGEGEEDVESYAHPGHIGAVEHGVPGKYGARDAENECQGQIDRAADGLAVEGCVFCGHDGGGYEERDAGVVDAGEAFKKSLV